MVQLISNMKILKMVEKHLKSKATLETLELAEEIVQRARELTGHEHAAQILRSNGLSEAVVITGRSSRPDQLPRTLCILRMEYAQELDEVSAA